MILETPSAFNELVKKIDRWSLHDSTLVSYSVDVWNKEVTVNIAHGYWRDRSEKTVLSRFILKDVTKFQFHAAACFQVNGENRLADDLDYFQAEIRNNRNCYVIGGTDGWSIEMEANTVTHSIDMPPAGFK